MTNTRAPSRIIPRAFPGIKPAEVEELISNSRINSYSAGAVLCRENAIEHTFYMILDGEAEVTKLVNNAESHLLKTLSPGDFFGEMALIHNAPRAATVSAKTPLVVLELEKAGFDRVLQHSSSVAMAMVKEISNRLRQNDQMAIEDLRMRAAELAEAYQKLAEQDLTRREFLTNVAHELRTPLMAASGYLQILQKGMLSGDNLREALTTVSRNVGQIIGLVNDILFLQEIELVFPEFQPVDMTEIARQVADKYAKKAEEHRVRLKVKGERDVPQIAGDPKSLERALTALIDNAIKFSPRGGDVEIRFNPRGNFLTVAVEDHGIGIAPEARAKIFDRFYHLEKSGDNLFGGIGIGLAITRQVIEQHRGKLEVESAPGHGSIFTMLLPIWSAKK
ncbi:MAG: cyclic nucleotide-binding domain-containing protein [Chloroflexi bacterium]|nr:cyclic nucleotide-binding domain-containing protein [Chloroflexota bacterium]MBI3338871.1 cyclic nucleotide-binding domain-containing protein [Chloroflexota bacterium]